MATNVQGQSVAMITDECVRNLKKYIEFKSQYFFYLLESIEDQTTKRNVAQDAFYIVAIDINYRDDEGLELGYMEPEKEHHIVLLCERLVDMFGKEFFVGQMGNRPDMTLDGATYTQADRNPLSYAYQANREQILMSSLPTFKSANETAAAQIRQALIRARGDPNAAAEMIKASRSPQTKKK
jgi:hypothetical protein